MEQNNKRRYLWIGVATLLALLMVFTAIYVLTRPDTSAGTKSITVTVIVPDQKDQSFAIRTDEEYLRGALEQEKLISGSESEYGLYVDTVNGIKADSSKNEWWCFTKGGQTLNTGVDTTPIENNDVFEITLSTY